LHRRAGFVAQLRQQVARAVDAGVLDDGPQRIEPFTCLDRIVIVDDAHGHFLASFRIKGTVPWIDRMAGCAARI
jgi:hypothetical protein